MKGKLIAIEGGDGSGKATQTKLLITALEKQGVSVKSISFPRYDTFYGLIIKKFLSGEMGSLESFSPHLLAIAYAADRKDARDQIISWLESGVTVVADRYVSSNQAHQAAKVSVEKRHALIDWISEMEYEVNQMPHPDMTIYLHVPVEHALGLLDTKDIAEVSDHQKKAEEVFLNLSNDSSWRKIECTSQGTLISVEDIHARVMLEIEKIL